MTETKVKLLDVEKARADRAATYKPKADYVKPVNKAVS